MQESRYFYLLKRLFLTTFLVNSLLAIGIVPIHAESTSYGKFLYTTDDTYDIWSYDSNSKNASNLTRNKQVCEGNNPPQICKEDYPSNGIPTWSYSDSKIYFISNRDLQPRIYRMNLNGTSIENIPVTTEIPYLASSGATLLYSRVSGEISISSDGNYLAYRAMARYSVPNTLPQEKQIFGVYVKNLQTGEERLVPNSSDFSSISLSPNGKFIVCLNQFTNYRGQLPESKIKEIYKVNVDGSNPKKLTQTIPPLVTEKEVQFGEIPTIDKYYAPKISPDGRKIIFFERGNKGTLFYVMNSDGTNRINILKNSPIFVQGTSPDKNYYRYPSYTNANWSKDARYLSFVSNADDLSLNIFIVKSDGTGLTQITDYSSEKFNNLTWISPSFNSFKLTRKLKTITCKKNAHIKKVIASKPRCPSGYSKKQT